MTKRTVSAVILGLLAWILHANIATAQPRSTLQRSSLEVRQSVAELASAVAHSVVEVRLGERTVALGTIVAAEGLVVTKASEIRDGAALNCRLWDDRQLTPEIIAQDEELDLALLRLPTEAYPSVQWAANRHPTSGSFLISIGPSGQTIGLGVVEVDERKFELRHPQANDRGHLGVNCSSEQEAGGLLVQQVTEGSAARRAGIRRGDVIVSIDDHPLSLVEQLIRELRKHKVGDQVRLVIRRGDEQLVVQANLGARTIEDPFDQWGGGPFSKRRFGFEAVIVHDTPIAPQQCGGPLLDTEGGVVGINIARALRVASYALPAEVVRDFVQRHAPAAETSLPSGE